MIEDIEVKIKLEELVELRNMASLYSVVLKERDEYKEKYLELLLKEKVEDEKV